MALTNLNALGSAIRGKVGEEEKQTIPELTSIVTELLNYTHGSQTLRVNGTYDVTNLESVTVDFDFGVVREVIVGSNNITSVADVAPYLGYSGNSSHYFVAFCSSTVSTNNGIQFLYMAAGGGTSFALRHRNGVTDYITVARAYDAVLVEGQKFYVCEVAK